MYTELTTKLAFNLLEPITEEVSQLLCSFRSGPLPRWALVVGLAGLEPEILRLSKALKHLRAQGIPFHVSLNKFLAI
jgi:hypothetical protein